MSLVDEKPASTYFPNLPVHIKRMGRPFGSRNHLSKTCKENIQLVFDGLGSWESMLEWARSNKDLFYGSIYPRLLANEGVTKGPGSIRVIVYGQTPTNISDDTPQPVVGEPVSDDGDGVSTRKDEDVNVSCTLHEPGHTLKPGV